MAAPTIKGEMFSITIDGPRAEIRIWRRPDLDSATGALNAERISTEAGKLAARGVRAVLLDVREAPAVAGPKTVVSLSTMMKDWAKAHLRVAILVNDDPIKVLQYTRVMTENAPRGSRVITDALEAKGWLASVV